MNNWAGLVLEDVGGGSGTGRWGLQIFQVGLGGVGWVLEGGGWVLEGGMGAGILSLSLAFKAELGFQG